jgi:hypothetical protein
VSHLESDELIGRIVTVAGGTGNEVIFHAGW